MNDILRDLERDIGKRRKNEQDRQKKHLMDQIGGGDFKDKVSSKTIERALFIGVIVVMALFITYDRVAVHPKLAEGGDSGGITSLVTENIDAEVEELSASTTVAEEETTTTTVEEETTTTTIETTTTTVPADLSGDVTIDLIDMDIDKNSDSVAKFNSVTFTIVNGLDESIQPVVDVFAFDDVMTDDWQTRSRGTYNEDQSVELDPGEEHSGSIILSPKTFSNLDEVKTVILKAVYGEDNTVVTARDSFMMD
tara:strand:+ start:5413 stop:6168 length:756 start_codon:yes stop_codon:yes gene_type:complete